MTHKDKDCVERPRSAKQAAWKSGLDIAPDEVNLKMEELGKVNYSTKRDAYKGYDADQYNEVIERHRLIEEERKKVKKEAKEAKRKEKELKKQIKEEQKLKKLEERLANNTSSDDPIAPSEDEEEGEEEDDDDSDSSDSGGEDNKTEFVMRDEDAKTFSSRTARQGGLGGAGMKTSTANLRIREDTPKYLYNLSLDSAHYDPKARSMRANPFPNENPEDLVFAGDNFLRQSGDAIKLAQNQVLCWDMQAKGEDIDMLSNPSQAEFMNKEFAKKKNTLEDAKRKALVDQYGGEKYLDKKLDPRLALGQTEMANIYAPDGRVIKGPQKASVTTKYEENVFTNNHTTVWGSFYSVKTGAWGYRCCQSLNRSEWCTGKVMRPPVASRVVGSMGPPLSGDGDGNSGSSYDSGMLAEKESAKKRAFGGEGVSEEDLEAYRLSKVMRDDPMANFTESE